MRQTQTLIIFFDLLNNSHDPDATCWNCIAGAATAERRSGPLRLKKALPLIIQRLQIFDCAWSLYAIALFGQA